MKIVAGSWLPVRGDAISEPCVSRGRTTDKQPGTSNAGFKCLFFGGRERWYAGRDGSSCERQAHEKQLPRSRRWSGKFTLDSGHVLGSVDSEVGLGGTQHGDFKAVMQSPQLFQ